MDGNVENSKPPRWERAVVIGSGLAGLITAAVLTRHFREVTVLERDSPPVEAAPRKGVPQGWHVHGLLVGGADSLEKVFSGLRSELSAGGAQTFDHGEGARFYLPDGQPPVRAVGLNVQTFSRGFLEAVVRRRVADLPSIRFEYGVTADRLFADQSGGSVRGVDAVRHGDGKVVRLEADLVVDCSGRFSRVADWLEGISYPRPAETVVDPQMVYASRFYQGPDTNWSVLYQPVCLPNRPRGAYAVRVEDGRLLVTLLGLAGNAPAAGEHGFDEFLMSVGNPELEKVVSASQPVSPIHRFARTENRRRELHRMRHWPDGFICLGDAYCTFNPAYGQGITVAAKSALRLDRELRRSRDLSGMSRKVQRGLHRIAFNPWMMATIDDRVWAAHITGQQPSLHAQVAGRYKNRLYRLILHNANAHLIFAQVFHAIRPPTALLSPRILYGVLREPKEPCGDPSRHGRQSGHDIRSGRRRLS
ncbi:2-polyprenyl-6-methoxyphenol hydroxylase-like FAD-dependent oxidoreductase [Lentzea atacamensis]|uniref:2-polyprenyl-6-methoxyphenol hydroxylase-like FAD-dependent oxidoreductase n=1 Tax=Lentzea atacamensis TaxID=531938 RepID=A0A316HA67_9PSEU|nr:NAD(P)-binding protein [Lentzea atacamensis]PWK77974.1 2-polyprenyl-6-methoxyphenol hydroxylase-like FAD-dependent oxidoreductase [Lentzea atacamensis]